MKGPAERRAVNTWCSGQVVMPGECEDLTLSSFFAPHLSGLSELSGKEKSLHTICFSGQTKRSQCNSWGFQLNSPLLREESS